MVFRQFAREIAVEVFLGHDVGAPRGYAAGAVVDRADNARAGRVFVGLDAVMAGNRTGELHRRGRRDAAVVLAVWDDLPLAFSPTDLDDRTAMGCEFNVDLLLRERALGDLAIFQRDEARE